MSFADMLRTATKPVGGRSAEQRSPGVSVDAVDPVPENRPETLLPYRGTEQHGVNVTGVTRVQDEREPFRSDVDVVVTHGNEPADPILVKVVQDEPNEVRAWRNVVLFADGTQRMIVGRTPERTKVRLYNTSGAVSVMIGSDSSVTPTSGYPLPAGKELELTTSQEIWAVSYDGSPIDIRALIEYRR